MLEEFINNLPFLPERTKIKKSKSLLLIYMIKMNVLPHKKFKASIKSWINFKKNS